VSMPSDVDTDLLIARLAGSLSPTARHAFRQAAEAALAHVPARVRGLSIGPSLRSGGYILTRHLTAARLGTSARKRAPASCGRRHRSRMAVTSDGCAIVGNSRRWIDRCRTGPALGSCRNANGWRCIAWGSPATRPTFRGCASDASRMAARLRSARHCFLAIFFCRSRMAGGMRGGRPGLLPCL
jgi:hypothetical protein